MTREWKPGDLVEAYIPTRSCRHRLVYVGERGGTWPWRMLDTDSSVEGCGIGADNVKDVRPLLPMLDGLIVIDPEDREQVKALRRAILGPLATAQSLDSIADALRSLITPPKPEEPTGRYAAVEDANGGEFVRLGDGPRPWMYNGSPSNRDTYAWADFDAVKILSPGVTQ